MEGARRSLLEYEVMKNISSILLPMKKLELVMKLLQKIKKILQKILKIRQILFLTKNLKMSRKPFRKWFSDILTIFQN